MARTKQQAKKVTKTVKSAASSQSSSNDEIIGPSQGGGMRPRSSLVGHIPKPSSAPQAGKKPSTALTTQAKKTIPSNPEGKTKKKRPAKRKSHILQQIRLYQGMTKQGWTNLIPRASMQRVIREITQTVRKDEAFMFRRDALEAIQESAEAYLVSLFETATCATIHHNRVTLQPKDMQLLARLRPSSKYGSREHN